MVSLKQHLKKIQSKGGKATWAKLTPAQRSEKGRALSKARWNKHKKLIRRVEIKSIGIIK